MTATKLYEIACDVSNCDETYVSTATPSAIRRKITGKTRAPSIKWGSYKRPIPQSNAAIATGIPVAYTTVDLCPAHRRELERCQSETGATEKKEK